MATQETFTQFNITYDVSTSTISATDPSLAAPLSLINALANGFKQSGFPLEVPPPPPNAVNPLRSEQVNKIKTLGNESFGKKQFVEAIKKYSQAIEIAASRPPWEPSALAADEMAILLCNRSAAFMGHGMWPEAYADAEATVELKKPWTKGHFRKAKALQGLGKLHEAKEAVERGMVYEPGNADLLGAMKEIDASIELDY